MGLFSRLFGRSSQDDRSYVRAWAEKRVRDISSSSEFSVENVFVAMTWLLSTFGKKSMRETIPPEMRGLIVDPSVDYSGDASLFEVGCYMFSQLECWLDKHKPHQAKCIVPFAKQFVELFSQALNSRDILALYQQRLSHYCRIYLLKDPDPEKYYFHLLQLIFRTGENETPTSYDFEHGSITVVPFTVQTGLRFELMAWEKAVLPSVIKLIEKYCDVT